MLNNKDLSGGRDFQQYFAKKNLDINIKKLIFAPRKWSRSSAG